MTGGILGYRLAGGHAPTSYSAVTRIHVFLKEQKLAVAVESAAKTKEGAGDDMVRLYTAACAYALCAGAARQAKPDSHRVEPCVELATTTCLPSTSPFSSR